MTPEMLRHLRETRALTREALAEFLGDCTASTVNKWERGMHDIPAWVEEKMLRSIEVKLPMDELLLLLREAQALGLSPEHLLGDAIRLWLEKTRPRMENPSQSAPDLVKPRAWTPETHPVQTAASNTPSRTSAPPPATANIVKLPAQHVVAGLNETSNEAPTPERDATLGEYPKPRRPIRRKREA